MDMLFVIPVFQRNYRMCIHSMQFIHSVGHRCMQVLCREYSGTPPLQAFHFLKFCLQLSHPMHSLLFPYLSSPHTWFLDRQSWDLFFQILVWAYESKKKLGLPKYLVHTIPHTLWKTHKPDKRFLLVLMDSLTCHLPKLTLCLHTGESTYKKRSMFCIISIVAPCAEYTKSHVLFLSFLCLSLMAQNLDFGKLAPPRRVSVHSGKISKIY